MTQSDRTELRSQCGEKLRGELLSPDGGNNIIDFVLHPDGGRKRYAKNVCKDLICSGGPVNILELRGPHASVDKVEDYYA